MTNPQHVAGGVVDAVNAHDLGALRSLYAPDARTRRPGWPQESGPEALLSSYEKDFACVPDIRFGPVLTFSDGPHVVTELRITGSNTGPTVLGDFGKALLGADVEWPEMFGCVLFLVSGHLAMTEICHRGRPCLRRRDLGWWIVAINQLGSILFFVSAVAGFIGRRPRAR